MRPGTELQAEAIDAKQGQRPDNWPVSPHLHPQTSLDEPREWVQARRGWQSRPEETSSEAQPTAHRQVLLLVDDDPDDLFFFTRALRKIEVSDPIYLAADGSETLKLLSELSSNARDVCLVLDVKLPDMSGFELLTDIRARRLPVSLRVVFLTGNRLPRLEMHARGCGADAFFNKPNWHEDWSVVAGAVRDLMREPRPRGGSEE